MASVHFRGRLQKAILRGLAVGQSLEECAAEVGVCPREMRRIALAMARKLNVGTPRSGRNLGEDDG